MRRSIVHPDAKSAILRIDPDRERVLVNELTSDLTTAYGALDPQAQCWAEGLRQYEGVPKDPIRNFPFENAPNYEVTLGAIAADALYAQAIDLIFNQVSPLVICQPTRDDKDLAVTVKHFHNWVNVMARTEWNVRACFEQVALDWDQLGTGVCTANWFHREKKTRVHKVTDVGAECIPHPVEDLIVPPGSSHDLQWFPWIALRYWYSKGELNARARPPFNWNVDGCQPYGTKSYTRMRREQLGRSGTTDPAMVNYFEIHDIFKCFDIDGDGLDEDLLITFDRTGQHIVKMRWMPYDLRNIIVARYQKRAHLFFALGVLEMMAPYEQELTDLHNDTAANSRLANMRMFKSRPNAIPGGVVHIHQGKVVETPSPEEFGELEVSDVYPSAYRNEAAIIAYAERRVGVRELSGPSPSRVIGGRTPGITALSVLQQVNQRFAPAFDDLRGAIASGIKQCTWRYREQLRGGKDKDRAAQNIIDVLGQEAGRRVVSLLMSDRFAESVSVEVTATSANFNKTQERQDAMMLNQMFDAYSQRALMLMQVASAPESSPAVKDVATQLAQKINEVLDRGIRTFDTIRDPSTFLVDMDNALDQMQLNPTGLEGLAQIIQQAIPQIAGPPGKSNGAAPAAPNSTPRQVQ